MVAAVLYDGKTAVVIFPTARSNLELRSAARLSNLASNSEVITFLTSPMVRTAGGVLTLGVAKKVVVSKSGCLTTLLWRSMLKLAQNSCASLFLTSAICASNASRSASGSCSTSGLTTLLGLMSV